jgi:NADH:ubiquinone oxidoreductase subunit F (NADH-binding)/ferredoxin
MQNSPQWFARFGTEKSKGTKTFALVGKVKNTGLIEVPLGTSMREIIFDIGGGVENDKEFKAVQTGGPSGGCLPARLIDLPVDYESLTAAGTIMGSGGLVVMDENTCMVDVARYFLDFAHKESCGKCAPCRLGTKQLLDILTDITEGRGRMEDLQLLEDLGKGIMKGSLCGLGQTAPNPVLTTLRYFRDEYVEHIQDKKCRARVCKELIYYDILPEKCTGCHICFKVCPVAAISGEPKQIHVIDQELCIKCGLCFEKCPDKFSAIELYPGSKLTVTS